MNWTKEGLLTYFTETSVDLLDNYPEENFKCLTPSQCAGYLLFLENGDARRAYLEACGLKAISRNDYKHWKEVVQILKEIYC